MGNASSKPGSFLESIQKPAHAGRPGGHVQPGYELGRDDTGLTARERQVLDLLYRKRTPLEIQSDLTLTKQRVYAIIASIKRKGRQLPGRP